LHGTYKRGTGHCAQILIFMAATISPACGGRSAREGSEADGRAGSPDAGQSPGLDSSLAEDVLSAGDGSSTPDDSSGVDACAVSAVSNCLISASHYDQSCSADSDCVRVDFGNYCDFLCRCGGDAINRASLNQFMGDIAMTPLEQGCISGTGCGCGAVLGPCCRGGQCATGPACKAETDAAVAADAAWDAATYGTVLCSGSEGPLDSGTAGSGIRWCQPGQSCTSVGGVWECCTSTGGPIVCVPP